MNGEEQDPRVDILAARLPLAGVDAHLCARDLLRTLDAVRPASPAPEHATPDDEGDDPLGDIADQVDGVVAAWDVFDPERDNLAELRGAVFRLRRLAAFPAPAAPDRLAAIRSELIEQLDGITDSEGPSTAGMRRALHWAVGMVDRITSTPEDPR